MGSSSRDKRIWIARAAGAGALAAVLVASVFGFALLGAAIPHVVLFQTGVVESKAGQLDIVPHQLALNASGQRIPYTLRTAPGEVDPSAMPSAFPVYPGATIDTVSRIHVSGPDPARGHV